MARTEFHHRMTLFDGHLVATDGDREIINVDAKDPAAQAQLDRFLASPQAQALDPRAVAQFLHLRQNPGLLLYYACDLSLTGWVDAPDGGGGAAARPEPPPGGGVALPRPVAPERTEAVATRP